MSSRIANDLSRADIVRQRREYRKPPRKQRISGRRQQQNMPRIISRGQYSTATLNLPQAKPARKKLSIPIGENTEINLPSIPRIKLGNRFASGILLLFMIACNYLILTSPDLLVQNVQVSGISLVNLDTISDLINVKGKTIYEVDPAEVSAVLEEEYPMLYVNADVSVQYPAEILIEVQERKPVIYWSTPEQDLWVDEEGVVLTPLQDMEGLAVVESSESPPIGYTEEQETDEFALMNSTVVSAVLYLQETLPEGTTLMYDSEHGLGWTAVEGWQVYLGVLPDQMKVRMAVYDSIVEYMNEKDYYPQMVSVEYLHAPFFR